MGFREGGQYLPGDYVDEGKLLFFIKEEVASRPPRRGRRLDAEKKRKRKAESELQPSLPPKQRRGGDPDAAIPILEEGEDVTLCVTASMKLFVAA